MLMWCPDDVLKFSTPKHVLWGHFLISLECSSSCVDTMNGWLQSKVAWLTRCSPSQPQRCLLQWLDWDGKGWWQSYTKPLETSRYFIHQQHASQIQLWRWYEDGMIFVSPMVPCCKFQCHAMAPMAPPFKVWGPGSLQVDESDVEQYHLFAAKVQAVHQEVPGGGRGGHMGNSNSIPKIVVGLSQIGWNPDWFQWSTHVLCSFFFAI